MYEWICDRENAILYSEPINLEMMQNINPKLVVSYNYKHIVKDDVIDFLGKRIINMHISYLPWNRGFSPNLWSFIEDTPKGVTIHQMGVKLDQGDVIYQRILNFNQYEESFESTYLKLNQEIVELFKKHYEELMTLSYKTVAQAGEGSSHTSKDLQELMRTCPFSWNERIVDVLNRIQDTKYTCEVKP